MAERVSWPVRLAYAAPAFALAVVGIPAYVYLPKFYTDVVGVSVTSLGALILGVRLFDALTDPAIGYLSDHTRTRFGRRRPYLIGGAPPLALLIYLLFVPPELSPALATWWFGGGVFLLFLAWTVIEVPYEALAPEMTYDYDERTTLLGAREGFLIAGTVVAAATPATLVWLLGLPDNPEGQRSKFFWMAVLYAPMVMLTCWACALAVRERAEGRRSSLKLGEDLRAMWRNRPFRILLFSYTVSSFGSNLPATLILYYVDYVLRSDKADLFLLIYFVAGIAFMPVWILISNRFGKKAAWLGAMALNTGAFAGVFFIGAGDETAYGILVLVSGLGLGGTLALPASMQADVIDYHELLTGKRSEGNYIGLWSIARKLAAALGVGLGLLLLGATGYEANIEQGPQVILTLRILYALVPSLCNLIAFAVALAYPVSKEKHQAIREAVERRRGGEEVSDPLAG